MANLQPSLPPELASILATLSQYAPAAPENTRINVQPEQLHVDPSSNNHHQEHAKDPRSHVRTPQPQAQPQRPIIDPATITEWTAGLRCVSKIAAQNPHFAEAIKRMMQNQRRQEMQWYSGRQGLKQDQARRGTGAGQLHSILKSVGGAVDIEQQKPQSKEELEAELADYDRKIYRAQLQMQEAFTAELRALGVPFFGTQVDCIADAVGSVKNADGDSRPKWSPLISSQELKELQLRMIKYLEDMYKD